MTFDEMLLEAELLYESIDSSTAPGFTEDEWSEFFTIAQRKVVLKILSDGIMKNAFNRSAIERLVQTDSYTAFLEDDYFKNSDGSKAQKLNVATKVLDSKFFWILDEYVSTGSGATLVTNIPVKSITYDFYRLNLDNPFKTPDAIDGYWILQYNTVAPTAATSSVPIFVTDGTAITGYYIVGVHHPDNYPIEPTTVYPTGGSQASCLNPSVHPRIVEEAVTLARMSVSDPQGYQLAVTEFSK